MDPMIAGEFRVERRGEQRTLPDRHDGIHSAALNPGETVEVVVIRDGSRRSIEIELGERPTAVSQP